MLLNMHFEKYRSNFENYTYIIVKREWTEIKKEKKYLPANRIFMSSFLCLVFLWPSGTGYWGRA